VKLLSKKVFGRTSQKMDNPELGLFYKLYQTGPKKQHSSHTTPFIHSSNMSKLIRCYSDHAVIVATEDSDVSDS
jgi:hypothetical protein